MMTFHCLRLKVRNDQDDVKTENPEGIAQVDFVTFIVQSYVDTLLRYVLTVTFCGAVVLKVMDQKTLVKRLDIVLSPRPTLSKTVRPF